MPPELLAQFPILEDALRRARRRRLADGRARGRRRAWPRPPRSPAPTRGSSGCSSARPTRTSAQCVEDPMVVAARPAREGTVIDEAGVRAQVRRESRLDPRLPGAGRRHRRRLPRPSRAGARSPPPTRARPVRAPRRDPRRRPRRGTSRCAARRSSRRRWRRRATPPMLFLDLATLRTDGDVGVVDDWEWRGARARARGSGPSASAPRTSSARANRLAETAEVTAMETLELHGRGLHVLRARRRARPTASSCSSCTGSRRRRTSGASSSRCSRPPATARSRPTSGATRRARVPRTSTPTDR